MSKIDIKKKFWIDILQWKKKVRKIPMIFDIENWLWTSNFSTFDTSPLTQFSKFNNFLWVCWFLGTIFQILYTPVEKSTTRILYSSVPSNSIYWMGHLILKFNLLGVWFDPQIQFSNFSCMFLNPTQYFVPTWIQLDMKNL